MTASPRPNRGPGAAADNRAALIRAARNVFAENGFEAPMTSIARTAGVGQGVLYRHFPTRESLALAVFDENITEIEAIADDPAATVDDILTAVVEQITTSAAFIAMIDPTSTEDVRLFEAAWRMINLITVKLEDPGLRGSLRGDITTADVILAISMLAAILTKTEPQSREATSRQAWRLLSRGLTG
ncbi:TetR/AcrR family transcriptional regulator [Nocardia jejuensis]|uniref:TetR/AcrR family transcriptional regulator n=1 Tax=Nocardia jejuensis TaxID=328049 RepID=UPI00082B18BE|nr:TetR/AcrR family transcriptional regulator [Nocardia jejuensis]